MALIIGVPITRKNNQKYILLSIIKKTSEFTNIWKSFDDLDREIPYDYINEPISLWIEYILR